MNAPGGPYQAVRILKKRRHGAGLAARWMQIVRGIRFYGCNACGQHQAVIGRQFLGVENWWAATCKEGRRGRRNRMAVVRGGGLGEEERGGQLPGAGRWPRGYWATPLQLTAVTSPGVCSRKWSRERQDSASYKGPPPTIVNITATELASSLPPTHFLFSVD